MNRSTPLMLILLVGILAAFPVASQTIDGLQQVLDYTITIKSLSEAVERGDYEPPAKFVILDGTYSELFDADPETGTVYIEVATGEWIGLEDVKSYHCLIRLVGDEYVDLFPARVSRDTREDAIVKGARMLIVALPLGVVELGDGRLIWLLDGIYYRLL